MEALRHAAARVSLALAWQNQAPKDNRRPNPPMNEGGACLQLECSPGGGRPRRRRAG
jgi:hypothetical protein